MENRTKWQKKPKLFEIVIIMIRKKSTEERKNELQLTWDDNGRQTAPSENIHLMICTFVYIPHKHVRIIQMYDRAYTTRRLRLYTTNSCFDFLYTSHIMVYAPTPSHRAQPCALPLCVSVSVHCACVCAAHKSNKPIPYTQLMAGWIFLDRNPWWNKFNGLTYSNQFPNEMRKIFVYVCLVHSFCLICARINDIIELLL